MIARNHIPCCNFCNFESTVLSDFIMIYIASGIHIYIHDQLRIHTYVCVYIYIYVFIYICICRQINIYLYMYVYIYTYVEYIYMQNSLLWKMTIDNSYIVDCLLVSSIFHSYVRYYWRVLRGMILLLQFLQFENRIRWLN